MGMEFSLKGISFMKPRIYKLGEITRRPIVVYSDAEWTALDKHPWLNKGLGGIVLKPVCKPLAAALDTPQHLVNALRSRKMQIIP